MNNLPVGVIGLGLMGTALTERLLAAGYPVQVFNRTREKAEPLVALGATWSPNPLIECERVIISLYTNETVQAVLAELDSGLRPGQILIDTTTGAPPQMVALGRRLGESGVYYLDAPISGSSEQTRRGEVTTIVGGESEIVRSCQDLMDCWSQQTIHAGPIGSGSKMKLVSNLVLGLNRAALAEGLVFAESIGLDADAALRVLEGSMAYSRTMDTKGRKMVESDFAVQARLTQHLKDVCLVAIVVYLLGVTAAGIYVGRRVTSLGDFFMPRRFGKGMMVMHAFGTGTASDQAVTVASATFQTGLSGIWYQWLWLFVTPFYWLIAPIFRRFRAVTTADVYELRFDRSVAVLFAIVGIANMSVKIGLMLKGAGVLIESATGNWVDTNLAILAITVMFVLSGAAGGLAAAIVTDYAQGLLTILFSLMLLPFIFSAVGGMAGAWATTLSGFAAWWLSEQDWFVDLVAGLPLAEPLRLVWTSNGAAEIDMPWKILFYTVVASLVGIVISLRTRQVSSERLDRFYLLSRTPIEPGETNDVPCQLPAKSNSKPRRMLVSSWGLEIPSPSKASCVGFVCVILCVVAMMSSFSWFVSFPKM